MNVADTDVLIDFLEKRGAWEKVRRELEEGFLATTSITRFELLSGSQSDRKRESALALLGALATLSLDARSADRAASVRRTLEAKGEGIGMADSLIAGIVLENRGTLLTRNRKHFERVEGLGIAE
ncbi:MAG TPA: type II toxin-antitoxin system VapC family toxin [Thermoanaerobaculia bacterium]|nr:type II toxin-antitoxin system VapC family toxin [Thermoanaerobaculia bacterium]